jgi:hypothetical protein
MGLYHKVCFLAVASIAIDVCLSSLIAQLKAAVKVTDIYATLVIPSSALSAVSTTIKVSSRKWSDFSYNT